MKRLNFTQRVQVEIIKRATRHNVIYCEEASCERPCTKFEIDHTVADALVVQKRALKAADGKLLCIPCHKAKTKIDRKVIAKAVNTEARHLGAEKPNKASIPSREKPERPVTKPSLPPRQLFRDIGKVKGTGNGR
jgi:5-methylcytosine-specific restriction endonuclease McrA